MALQFTSAPVQTVPAISSDDLLVSLSSAVFSSHHIKPLLQKLDDHSTSCAWRLATAAKYRFINGARLENALWRIWSQQISKSKWEYSLEFDWNRFSSWDGEALLSPLFASNEMYFSKIQLATANAHPTIRFTTATRFITPVSISGGRVGPLLKSAPLRPCLKHLSSSSTNASSSISFNNQTSSSTQSGIPRRVIFNACVMQCKILEADASHDGNSNFSKGDLDRDTAICEGFEFSISNEVDGPGIDESHTVVNIRTNPSRFIPDTDIRTRSIESLPPLRLAGTGDDEDGTNVRFVPPRGMETLSEDKLLVPRESKRYKTPTPERSASRVSLVGEHEASLSKELRSLGFPDIMSSASESGELVSVDNEDGVLVTRSGRKRRKRRLSFIFDEDDRDWSQEFKLREE